MVQGAKLSFVGRNGDARLARLEATLKMLDALLLVPDFLPQEANLPGSCSSIAEEKWVVA